MDGSRKIKTPFIKPAIAHRLLSWFLLSALVPLLVVGYIAYNHSVEILRTVVTNNLETIAQRKVDYINSYFQKTEKDLAVLARSLKVIDSLSVPKQAFKGGGKDFSRYMPVDGTLGAFLTHFKEIYGYYDLFLISTLGDIFFTVLREDDFGTNLVSGPYKDSYLAEVFSKAIASKMDDSAVFLTPLRYDAEAALKRKVVLGSRNALPGPGGIDLKGVSATGPRDGKGPAGHPGQRAKEG
jgi:hypothetical protein